jgi:hypothetical protein
MRESVLAEYPTSSPARTRLSCRAVRVIRISQADQVRLPLSAASRTALAHYLTGLQPGLLADSTFDADPRNRDRTTHVYPLADLAQRRRHLR